MTCGENKSVRAQKISLTTNANYTPQSRKRGGGSSRDIMCGNVPNAEKIQQKVWDTFKERASFSDIARVAGRRWRRVNDTGEDRQHPGEDV